VIFLLLISNLRLSIPVPGKNSHGNDLCCNDCQVGRKTLLIYTPFLLHDRANFEQTSSRHRANIKQAWWNSPPGSNVGLGLAHVLYRPSNYNLPAFLISMLITIARRASWMNSNKQW